MPGATAYTTNLLRPYRGLGTIEQNTTEFWDTYHSMQILTEPAFPQRVLASAPTTRWGCRSRATPGCVKRLQHSADGTFSLRADQAEYEELNENLDMRPHVFKANAIWATAARARAASARSSGAILNDWQIAGRADRRLRPGATTSPTTIRTTAAT